MTHLLWAGVVVFALVRGERVLRDWWRHRYPAAPLTEQDVVVPQDIVALAMRESEEWAQEQVLQTAAGLQLVTDPGPELPPEVAPDAEP